MAKGGNYAEALRGASLRDALPSSVVLAHELKAPLALIRQLTFALDEPDMTDDQRAALLGQIRLTGERALRFASNIAASEQSQQKLFASGPLSAMATCGTVLREIQPLYAAHGRRLELRQRSRDYLGVANGDLLHRILMNFADNALEYSDPDSVVELFVSLQRSREKVRLGVRDRKTRAGARPVLGRPLQYDRHGLGLTIAHVFAREFDGEIGATKHRDGTSFYIDIGVSKQLALL